MSSLLNHLAGKQSVILYKKYFSKQVPKPTHVCMLRFEVDGWSSVVIGIAPKRYLAGAKALQAYVEFCEAMALDYKDSHGLFEGENVDYGRYELTDKYYGEEFD